MAKKAGKRRRPERGLWWNGNLLWVDFTIRRPDGTSKRFREPAGTTLISEARAYRVRRMAEEGVVAARRGTLRSVAVSQAIALYEAAEKSGRAESFRHDVNRIRRTLGAWMGPGALLEDVTPRDIAMWSAARQAEVAPNTAMRDMMAISGLFRWASAHGLCDVNPVAKAPKPRVGNQKKEIDVTAQEVRETLAAIDRAGESTLAMCVRLAAYQALRRGELLRIRWDHVDLDKGTMLVPGTKTARSRAVIPVNPEMLRWLQDSHDGDTGCLVRVPGSSRSPAPITVSALRWRADRFRRQHGARVRPWHDYRHWVATEMLRAGESLPKVAEFLRDDYKTVNAFYSHLVAEDLRGTAARISLFPGERRA